MVEVTAMPTNIRKEDLRIIKTEKALDDAIFLLLERQKFKEITVKSICEAAIISRATFYGHFSDKYDLLKYSLIRLKPENLNRNDSYEKIEKAVNELVQKNEKVLSNLINDADNETLEIVFEFIISSLDLAVEKNKDKKTNPQYVVLSNFCAGGMIHYLLWQIENKYPPNVAPMNKYLYEIIGLLQNWESKQLDN